MGEEGGGIGQRSGADARDRRGRRVAAGDLLEAHDVALLRPGPDRRDQTTARPQHPRDLARRGPPFAEDDATTPADDEPTTIVPTAGGLPPGVVAFWRRFLAARPEARDRGLYDASRFGDDDDAATADECAAFLRRAAEARWPGAIVGAGRGRNRAATPDPLILLA